MAFIMAKVKVTLRPIIQNTDTPPNECQFAVLNTTMQSALLIFTNVPDLATAQALGRQLVINHLAACVNILPGVQSIYRWKDVVEQASEVTLLIKSEQARYAELESAICASHPYNVPEIIAVPLTAGLPAYLDWIASETRKEIDA